MNQLTPVKSAYIAGFLDGDGSIYVRLKPNKTYKYGFQVAPYIVFYQSQKQIEILEALKEIVGAGYIRLRKDGIAEYTIGDVLSMRELINQIGTYLILKSKQAQLLIKILDSKTKVKSSKDFEQVATLIDKFSE